MKKFSSILFLAVLFLFNYWRTLSYFQCRVENFIQSGTATCDCEKQGKPDGENGLASTSPKSNLREKPADSEYTQQEALGLAFIRDLQHSIPSCLNTAQLPMGAMNAIFQPPRDSQFAC